MKNSFWIFWGDDYTIEKRLCGKPSQTVYDVLSRGEEVKITGFGTFKTRKIAAHEGINPQNGKKIKVAETVVPAFKPGSDLRNAVKV